jgi:hypothetical protein
MSAWTNRYTCPGYMYVPRKPWPQGNEYHTACCGTTGILFRAELVEGKDHPPHVPVEFPELGKTVGLLLRMTKPLWHKGHVVVLDSGFCVLEGIARLREKGVFAASLIKKRKYWPKHIKGDDYITHFEDKEVGDVDCLPGKLMDQDFYIFCMKEPDYIMSLMSSYGSNKRIETKTTRRDYENSNGEMVKKTFHYPEVIYNHFNYRHVVDDHNNKRHQPISIEEIWATKWWPNRCFAFFFAVAEVNCKLFYEFFCKQPTSSMINFRKMMAQALLMNTHMTRAEIDGVRLSGRKKKRDNPQHELLTMPQYKTWRTNKWVKLSTQFHQRKCIQCNRRVRTYCACDPNNVLCQEHYWEHRDAVRNDHGDDH